MGSSVLTNASPKGRDDWQWVSNTGETWTYTNNRGCTKGTLQPLWRPGSNTVDGAGHTHIGLGKDIGRGTIHFAKVFGEAQSIGLGGRADYIWIEEISETDSKGQPTGSVTYNFHVWQNVGGGATKLKGSRVPCILVFLEQ